MSRMNWNRASNEYRFARTYDYSARMDDDEQVPVHLLEPAKSKKKRKKKKPASATGAPKDKLAKRNSEGPPRKPEIITASRRTRTRGSAGRSTLESVKAEAARTGKTVHEVLAERRTTQPTPTDRPKRTGKVVVSSRSRSAARSEAARLPRGTPTERQDSKGEAKRLRTEREAAQRGMSVEQLIAERRRISDENLALHDEATRLGITVKELRKLRGRRA